jgi:hypothetical protein
LESHLLKTHFEVSDQKNYYYTFNYTYLMSKDPKEFVSSFKPLDFCLICLVGVGQPLSTYPPLDLFAYFDRKVWSIKILVFPFIFAR